MLSVAPRITVYTTAVQDTCGRRRRRPRAPLPPFLFFLASAVECACLPSFWPIWACSAWTLHHDSRQRVGQGVHLEQCRHSSLQFFSPSTFQLSNNPILIFPILIFPIFQFFRTFPIFQFSTSILQFSNSPILQFLNSSILPFFKCSILPFFPWSIIQLFN